MNHIFFFNDTATTEIYTLSLHDALPIYERNGAVGQRDPELTDEVAAGRDLGRNGGEAVGEVRARKLIDRKSTRLNSSHANISYAVFCLKKKKITTTALSTYE